MPTYEEYCEEIKSIWETVHLTNMGPIHNRLKEQVKDYLKVGNIELFVNGHLALYCALKALNLKGEIITTPFTFASTTNAKIEELITEKTTAILGVHVYGNICDVEAIQKIADKHNLKVIYDAAHAFGVEYKGKGIGSYGDVSMFSFHATKVFHTIEGGCLTFQDEALTKEIALQRNFGVNGEELACFGSNAKMNEFQAAMGICNLRHIDEELALRKDVFERYTKRLEDVPGITLLPIVKGIKQNYAYYPVLIEKEAFGENRDELCERLAEKGVFARKYFYPLVSENKEFEKDMTENTPKAKAYSRNIVCLPLYAHLSLAGVDRICDCILQK